MRAMPHCARLPRLVEACIADVAPTGEKSLTDFMSTGVKLGLLELGVAFRSEIASDRPAPSAVDCHQRPDVTVAASVATQYEPCVAVELEQPMPPAGPRHVNGGLSEPLASEKYTFPM